MKRLLLLAAFLFASVVAPAEDAFNDGIDRNAPDFVKASVLIMTPGDELFSCVGHAAIRLECPKFDLDYCFSCESESAKSRVATFLQGALKMGFVAVPTAEFLEPYDHDRRGVRQYALNLPPAVKQRLWQILDAKAAEGVCHPYDYIQRGCAKAVLDCLKEACAPKTLTGPVLSITQRETFFRELSESYPWTLFALNALVGTETDTFVEVVTPGNLLRYLERATLDGIPLLQDTGVEIRPQTTFWYPGSLTPFVTAWIVVALLVGAIFVRSRVLDVAVLSVPSVAGLFLLYLMSASGLPTSCWNWLIVPFNPIPLLAWRGRRYWAVPYAVIIGAWTVCMLLSAHVKTDPTYLVLAVGIALFSLKFVKPQGKGTCHE